MSMESSSPSISKIRTCCSTIKGNAGMESDAMICWGCEWRKMSGCLVGIRMLVIVVDAISLIVILAIYIIPITLYPDSSCEYYDTPSLFIPSPSPFSLSPYSQTITEYYYSTNWWFLSTFLTYSHYCLFLMMNESTIPISLIFLLRIREIECVYACVCSC